MCSVLQCCEAVSFSNICKTAVRLLRLIMFFSLFFIFALQWKLRITAIRTKARQVYTSEYTIQTIGHTVWIKLSHWLVCHFSTELFYGRSANTKSKIYSFSHVLLPFILIAFTLHYILPEWKT